jgi:hypothetical protein
MLTSAGGQLKRFDAQLDETSGAEWAGAQAPLHALVFEASQAVGRGGRDGLDAAHLWFDHAGQGDRRTRQQVRAKQPHRQEPAPSQAYLRFA